MRNYYLIKNKENEKMKNISLVCLFSAFTYTGSALAEIQVSASSLGWYNVDGEHDSSNKNTLTGYLADKEYRSFFTWQIPTLSEAVTSGLIRIEITYGFGASNNGPLTGEMFDITSDNFAFLTSTNGAGNGQTIFTDLGTGNTYGNITVQSNFQYGYTFDVVLNSSAIEVINNSSGGVFGLGMKVIGDPSSNPYFLFSDYYNAGSQILVLNPAATVPEPNSYALLLAGLGLLGFAARLRSCN
jgi:hypothetical protein